MKAGQGTVVHTPSMSFCGCPFPWEALLFSKSGCGDVICTFLLTNLLDPPPPREMRAASRQRTSDDALTVLELHSETTEPSPGQVAVAQQNKSSAQGNCSAKSPVHLCVLESLVANWPVRLRTGALPRGDMGAGGDMG